MHANQRKTVTVEYNAEQFEKIKPFLKQLGWARTNIDRPYNNFWQNYKVTFLYPSDLSLLKLKYNV